MESYSFTKTQTNPYQPEDLFALKFIRAGKLSPDGKKVVYCLSETIDDQDRFSLWVHTLATGESRRVTQGCPRDFNPAWSPDGAKIAFLSDRLGKPQVFILPADFGEAFPLTSLKQGAGGGPIFSPDGKTIAFTAGPESEPPDPTKPYRVTRALYRFDTMGYIDPMIQDVYLISMEGGQPTKLLSDGWMNTPVNWSQDGSTLLVLSLFKPESYRTSPVLRSVTLDGEVKTIIDGWGEVGAAVWHPDGEHVVFMGKPKGQLIGSKNDLWVMPVSGGEPICRTSGLPMGIGGGLQGDMPIGILRSPQILLDREAKNAYIQVQEGGCIRVYQVALFGNEQWKPVLSGDRAVVPLDVKCDTLLAVESDTNRPLDLIASDIDGTNERRLTFTNDSFLATRDSALVERLEFHGTDGTPVEGWFLKPTRGQPPYPTILYIHGGPHSGFGHVYSFDFHMLAGAGFGVLFINQRGSKGYDDDFANKIIGDWGHHDYSDLICGLDLAIENGLADPDRLGICGLSGGGNLTCWAIGHTDRFKAAVPENPVTNWFSFYGVSDIGVEFSTAELGGHPYEIPEVYTRCSPITYAHQCTTPTLFIQGEADYRCPAEQSEQFYTIIKAKNCIAEMVRLPNSPHAGSMDASPAIRRAQNEALLGWMKRFVLGIDASGSTN